MRTGRHPRRADSAAQDALALFPESPELLLPESLLLLSLEVDSVFVLPEPLLAASLLPDSLLAESPLVDFVLAEPEASESPLLLLAAALP